MSKELSDKEIEDKVVQDALKNFYAKRNNDEKKSVEPTSIPEQIAMPDMSSVPLNNIEQTAMTENDPDLLMTYEIVPLPSKGMFYQNGLSEIKIEYLTSRDEDLLTTPSFIEDGSVMDRLLERKIVDKGINPKDLLVGDRSALILFLRTSSYGNMYKVSVPDPRSNTSFEAEIDLLKLKYKNLNELPDQNGEYVVEIPMRKKIVKFRLLTAGQEDTILKNAEARKEAYGSEVSEFSTLRLKASVVEIDGKRDQSYIDRFIDVMPALDAYTIRKKILEVSPEVDMTYEFKAPDGYKFIAPLSMGIDFFFPSH